MTQGHAIAVFGNQMATQFVEATTDINALNDGGWWAVTQTFEGEFAAFRFESVQPLDLELLMKLETLDGNNYSGIATDSWISSMSQQQYTEAVESIKTDIARGWVYQANLCRVLSAPLTSDLDVLGLYKLLAQHNPAPYLSALMVPKSRSGFEHDVRIVSASPELFISRKDQVLRSSPIKGTARIESELLAKDQAENIMIVDLIRNDLGQVCESGSVQVIDLLRIEQHPGLVHLVSDIEGTLPSSIDWQAILSALSPPGSVSGAPKSSALEVIRRLEKVPREIYCGGFGWIDVDQDRAQLAVGIRTFWQSETATERKINFGTGAGITWDSDPLGEWHETQLKASRLLDIAAMEID
jgi:para-aminobenzoate synthetase component 1